MRSLLIVVFIVASTPAAMADWWLVRSADGVCLVVDVEPRASDKTVTKLGKDSYQTEDDAKADLKRLCEEPKVPPKPNRG